jgi:hypothetical protein
VALGPPIDLWHVGGDDSVIITVPFAHSN